MISRRRPARFAAAAAVAVAVMLGIADDARAQDLIRLSVLAVPEGDRFERDHPLVPPFSTGETAYSVFVRRAAGQFSVEQSNGVQNSGTTIDGVVAGSNTFTITGFPIMVDVVVSVSGSPKTYTITVRTVPAAPVLETPTVLSRSLALNWTAPSDNGGAPVTGYKVRWAAESAPETYLNTDGAAGIDAPGGANAASYTITGLSDRIAYQVQIAAANTYGATAWTAAQSATPATGVVEAAICIFAKVRGAVSYAQCLAAAESGYQISKSNGGAHEFVVVAYLSGAFGPLVGGTSANFTLIASADLANPLLANADIEGALPGDGAEIEISDGTTNARATFALTPKTSGNGGRLNFTFAASGTITDGTADVPLADLAANQIQGTFLQISESADVNFTAADADGSCPAANNAALTALSLAEAGDAAVLCMSLQSAPAANVSLTCTVRDARLIDVPGAREFTAANYARAQAFRLRAPDNNVANGAQSAETLTCIATGDAAYARLAKTLALNITDTDAVAATGALSAGNISENGGAQMVEITATIGGSIASPTDCTVTVEIGTAQISPTLGDALAAAPGDYAAFSPPVITIAAGELSGSAMVAVTPVADGASDAASESIPLAATALLCGGAATIDFGDAEIVIFDTGLRISQAEADGSCPSAHNADASAISLEEGGAGKVVCVSLLRAPSSNVDVTCAGAASPDLVAATPAPLTFTTANYDAAQAVTVQAVDNDISAPSTDATDPLTCTASADPVSGYSGISQALAVTITDATDPDTVSDAGATLSATNVAEGSVQFVLLTATLGGAIAPAEGCTVTLAIETAAINPTRADEIAVLGVDYMAFTLPSITIPARARSGSVEFQLNTTDLANDGNAMIESIPISGASTSCGGASNLAFAAAEILIIDVRVEYSLADAGGNCPATPTADISRVTQTEGEATSVCIRLNEDPGLHGVTAMDVVGCTSTTHTTQSETHFDAFSAGAAGTWKSGHLVTLTALHDDISRGDITTEFISCGTGIINPNNPREFIRYGAYRSFSENLRLTVTEDDIVATTGVLTAGSIGESGGAQMVRITATLDGTARPAADCAVSVSIDSSAISETRGTAVAVTADDYTGTLAAPAITIRAGELSGSGLLAITPVVDADDAIESIPLSASAACGGAGVFMGGMHGSEDVAFGVAEILILDFNLALLDGAAGMTHADGILVVRYLAGARGADLTAGLGLADAASVAVAAAAVIDGNMPLLDVDEDSEITMADGIMIARYSLGVTSGAALIDGQAASAKLSTVMTNIGNLSP
ncbi:MAG: fibronectin type III domain-containing protein [Gammaproteobacteria bacterium]